MKKLILPLSIALLFVACSEQDKRKTSVEKQEKEQKEPAPVREDQKRSYYPIPSPEQMFAFISDEGLTYNKDLVHDPELSDSYHDPTHKALIFGVYTADLAYTAAYQDVESTIKLYKVVRRLSIDLHIEELMTDEMMENMQANMENPDSLALIAGDSYYRAVEHLESNGQESKLALMSLGGFIESVHITFSAMKDIDMNSATVERIASQKITFGNLYTYLKKNEGKLGIKGELEKLQRIKAAFATVKDGASAKSTKSESGKLVFGRGKKMQITIEQFLELKAAVETYRTQMVAQNV